MFKVQWPYDDAVRAFLTVRPPPAGATHYWASCFSAVIRDARDAAGRDLDSGEVIEPHRAGSWLGALAYLVMLDQVGDCFRPAGAPLSHGPAIVRALRDFAQVEERVIQAIYALRCSFAHDYSLQNNRPGTDTHHVFRLTAGDSPDLVHFPVMDWDGRPKPSRAQETLVDLVALGNLAEGVAARLMELHDHKQLILREPLTLDELFARYAFSVEP